MLESCAQSTINREVKRSKEYAILIACPGWSTVAKRYSALAYGESPKEMKPAIAFEDKWCSSSFSIAVVFSLAVPLSKIMPLRFILSNGLVMDIGSKFRILLRD